MFDKYKLKVGNLKKFDSQLSLDYYSMNNFIF